MKPIIIPRAVIRWSLTILIMVAVGLSAANIYHLASTVQRIERVEASEREERFARAAEIAKATLATCAAQNELRATLRGTLTRAAEFRRSEGRLTPRVEAFYSREIRGLADIDCRAIVPEPTEAP